MDSNESKKTQEEKTDSRDWIANPEVINLVAERREELLSGKVKGLSLEELDNKIRSRYQSFALSAEQKSLLQKIKERHYNNESKSYSWNEAKNFIKK